MEVVIFSGVQAAGKSTFYQHHFFKTHIRINLDMLKSRHREQILVQACLDAKQPFVVDNTNPTAEVRAKYLSLAKQFQFQIIGYEFKTSLKAALARNASRDGSERIPDQGVTSTYHRLEALSFAEGFDQIHWVQIGEDQTFIVESQGCN